MFIKGPFVTLNPYNKANRGNKYGGAKIMKDMTRLVYFQALNKPKIETPCKLQFTWHIKNRKTDPDNIAFCKKYILDGLVKAQVIPDDTFAHIKGFIDEFVISNKVGVKIERVE